MQRTVHCDWPIEYRDKMLSFLYLVILLLLFLCVLFELSHCRVHKLTPCTGYLALPVLPIDPSETIDSTRMCDVVL